MPLQRQMRTPGLWERRDKPPGSQDPRGTKVGVKPEPSRLQNQVIPEMFLN